MLTIMQTVAWALSLVNIGVEVLGALIAQIMENDKRKSEARAMASDDAKPLMNKYDDLDTLGNELHETDRPKAAK